MLTLTFIVKLMIMHCLFYLLNGSPNNELYVLLPWSDQNHSSSWLLLQPSDVKSLLTGKDPDAGKDEGLEEKGLQRMRLVGWHQWFDGYEFEQTTRDSEGQGSLACCSPWGCKELNMNLRLKNIWYLFFYFPFPSLCIIDSKFIHLIKTDSNSFLFMAE